MTNIAEHRKANERKIGGLTELQKVQVAARQQLEEKGKVPETFSRLQADIEAAEKG